MKDRAEKRSVALNNLENEDVDVSRAWESINVKTTGKVSLDCCKLKHHKLQFGTGCSKLSYKWKQAELQWL
jgi:hypothetical protein